MSSRKKPTCNDCYFGRAGLCALAGEVTCPTFRAASPASKGGTLVPPPQARLVPRTHAQAAA